jgi:hypothetical protein
MIRVTHNCGFFSCLSVKLHHILDYFNKEKKLPEIVDSSEQFIIYKPHNSLSHDITYHLFKRVENEESNINYANSILYDWDNQFKEYKNLNIDELSPFISNYFSPSDKILDVIDYLINKYSIEPEKICAVYYRGTDKFQETPIDDYEIYINKMKEVTGLTYLVQSDDQLFIDKVLDSFNNIIIIKEDITSYKKIGVHNEYNGNINYLMIHYFLATILIMAKCNYFICSSSNCSVWTVYYRGNSQNVIQNLNKKWIL